MSRDARLRQGLRSGNPDDPERLARDCLRAGELTPDQRRFAALCGETEGHGGAPLHEAIERDLEPGAWLEALGALPWQLPALFACNLLRECRELLTEDESWCLFAVDRAQGWCLTEVRDRDLDAAGQIAEYIEDERMVRVHDGASDWEEAVAECAERLFTWISYVNDPDHLKKWRANVSRGICEALGVLWQESGQLSQEDRTLVWLVAADGALAALQADQKIES